MTGFDAAAFQALRQGRFGAELHGSAQAASTQDQARAALAQGAKEGAVFLAESQSSGRGRWGKRWQGVEGKSLLFTVLLDAGGQAPAALSVVLGLASAEALRSLGAEGAGVKWPNDLWSGGKKLGGLLLEAQGPWVLAGCGLNVGHQEQDLGPSLGPSATSLHLQGLDLAREAVLAALLKAWEQSFDEWKTGGFSPFLARFEALDALKGQSCTVRTGGLALAGRYLGVDQAGALRLGLADGSEKRLLSAEIEQLRPGTPD